MIIFQSKANEPKKKKEKKRKRKGKERQKKEAKKKPCKIENVDNWGSPDFKATRKANCILLLVVSDNHFCSQRFEQKTIKKVLPGVDSWDHCQTPPVSHLYNWSVAFGLMGREPTELPSKGELDRRESQCGLTLHIMGFQNIYAS